MDQQCNGPGYRCRFMLKQKQRCEYCCIAVSCYKYYNYYTIIILSISRWIEICITGNQA